MILTPFEVELFFTTWIPLLHYVNQQKKVIDYFPARWGEESIEVTSGIKVRDALWEHDDLRYRFIAENPAALSTEALTLIKSWDHRVSGTFFVMRHLKKHTIFLDDKSPAKAYAVFGITNPLDEVIPFTPFMVKAVLIPFGDRIIYDSLLASFPVHFGGGYRSSFNDTYRSIQERGSLITQLPPQTAVDPKQVAATNKKVITAFQKDLGAVRMSLNTIQQHSENITAFAANYLSKQKPPRMLLDITQADIEAYRKKVEGKINLVSFKRFVRFLQETARMDWEAADTILDYLKQK
jgi:hypothetical protein